MKPVIAGLLAGLLTASMTAAAEAPDTRRLKHDPFDWSALTQAIEKKDSAAAAPVAAPPRPPRLRALMQAPSGARVDLEGVILTVGESAGGYRLIEVREQSAVFSRNGATVEIELSRDRTP